MILLKTLFGFVAVLSVLSHSLAIAAHQGGREKPRGGVERGRQEREPERRQEAGREKQRAEDVRIAEAVKNLDLARDGKSATERLEALREKVRRTVERETAEREITALDQALLIASGAPSMERKQVLGEIFNDLFRIQELSKTEGDLALSFVKLNEGLQSSLSLEMQDAQGRKLDQKQTDNLREFLKEIKTSLESDGTLSVEQAIKNALAKRSIEDLERFRECWGV